MTNRDSRDISLRLGLIGTGLVVLQSAAYLWVFAESFIRPAALILSILGFLVGMICLVLAMVTRVPHFTTWLILSGLIGALWSSAYIEQLNYSPLTVSHSDNGMIAEYAAEAMRRGFNPYQWNFSDITRVFRDRGLHVTTFLDGSVQNRLTYPALPTLVLVAFGAIGLESVRGISLIFHTILLILLFVAATPSLRPIILLPLFIIKILNHLTLGGVQDIVWSTLLVAMILAWQRPTLRAILFGLACAYRQQPWLVAPFLIIYMWNESTDVHHINETTPSSLVHAYWRQPRMVFADVRVRRILQFTGICLGVFLLINLPFMLWDLHAWILGVFEPVYSAFNVHSEGLGLLSKYNLVRIPREFYTSLQLSSLAIMILIHWRHPRWVGQAFWIFPGIFFWLYYRGLVNYWLYWIPPLIIAIARFQLRTRTRREFYLSRRPTAFIIAAVAAFNLMFGALLLQRPPTISANMNFPIESFNGFSVARLGMKVTNTSHQMLRPRFSVQHDGLQPLPWTIEEGPEQLKPGETGRYIISTFLAWRDFSISRGAQVVITDAGNNFALRAVIDVPGDGTFDSPDLITNPSFGVWSSDQSKPAGWLWFASEAEQTRPQFETLDGRSALLLAAARGTSRLSQTVTFPDSISIWVRPTASAPDPLHHAYGLEFEDGRHRLWVLFGDRAGSQQVSPIFAVVYIRAPLNQWSRQTVAPPELYAQFGWELPAYSIRSRQGLQFAARQVMLSLLVSGTREAQAFGPIEQDPGFASPRTLIAEAIAHPDDYYVNMGDEYCRQRNLELAREAYLRALAYNPDSLAAGRGLESCR